jgi:predicted dinucleotide-utilizing enzyme
VNASHRIGIIGFGFIGSSLFESLSDSSIEVVSVLARNEESIVSLPATVATTSSVRFLQRADELDLVIEVANPQVSFAIGRDIVRKTSYMPCSVAALADDGLRTDLLAIARERNTRLYIPHGAVAGLDNFIEGRDRWASSQVTFRKPPASIDQGSQHDEDEVVIFEGSAREIAEKFPRSVNSMVTFALATMGLDKTVTRMVSDRRLENMLTGEFRAEGKDGSSLSVFKSEPAVGVSSTGMVNSIRGSVFRALGAAPEGLGFV